MSRFFSAPIAKFDPTQVAFGDVWFDGETGTTYLVAYVGNNPSLGLRALVAPPYFVVPDNLVIAIGPPGQQGPQGPPGSPGESVELATTGAPVNVGASAPPTHAGQLLISQPGNGSAVWADPLVQGLQAEGTSVAGLKPVLVGAKDPSGNLQDLNSDADGNLKTRSVLSGKSATQQGYIDVKVTPTGALPVMSEASVTGDLSVSVRRNQTDINFSTGDATDATLITNTMSGSGAITQANGGSIYASGTAAAGDAKGSTVQSIKYRGASDVLCLFTASFTMPTDANATHSFQRIGLYGTTDGVYLGMEGQGFTVSVRQASVDTHTAQASFNLDQLNGGPTSGFTRNGVPEAVDFTKLNVFRIRFSWFGVANVFWDIFTPDGGWLPFHVLRYPNTATIPFIASPNQPITLEVFKTASDATNLKIFTACWAAGINESAIRLNDPIVDSVLAIPTRSVLVGKMPNGLYTNVLVDQYGSLKIAPAKLITYQAVFRLAARPYPLSHVFGAAGRYQFATIFHTALSTKTVKLRHAVVSIENSSAVSDAVVDLVRITTAPVTGNPAITPTQSNAGDAAAETTCLALPTTQATEGGVFGTQEYPLGITGANSVINPPPALIFQDLINPGSASEKDIESELPTMRAGVAEGWAVTVDTTTAVTLTGIVILTFTEE